MAEGTGAVKARARRHALRALVWLLLALALLAAFGFAGVLWRGAPAGRTPDEVFTYLQRRLGDYPTLEVAALPVLEGARRWLGRPDGVEADLPFIVPPVPPNPARGAPLSSTGSADPRVIRVGPGRAISRIGVAARLAVDGSVIEIDPGDYVADVALWDRGELTIRGMGDRVRLLAAGASAEGKAIWVVRRGNVTIENIQFVGARVADRNGAGIRMEGGHLRVRRCTFWDNENGILTSNSPGARLEVEQSEFGYNGAGDGASHGIYVGAIDSFSLTGSYIHHGNVGHLVKSRARRNRIVANRLSDEAGGRASYELELPNGGEADVIGNVIEQTTGTRNSTIVSFGAEGYSGPRNVLRFIHNTVINDETQGGTFLRVRPGADLVVLRNNLFVGIGLIDGLSVVDAAGDRSVDWRSFVRPQVHDYRLSEPSRSAWREALLAPVAFDALPRMEYVHPMGLHMLNGPARWPGALQASAP